MNFGEFTQDSSYYWKNACLSFNKKYHFFSTKRIVISSIERALIILQFFKLPLLSRLSSSKKTFLQHIFVKINSLELIRSELFILFRAFRLLYSLSLYTQSLGWCSLRTSSRRLGNLLVELGSLMSNPGTFTKLRTKPCLINSFGVPNIIDK